MPKSKRKQTRKGSTVYYWHTSSCVLGVTFVRWCISRRGCGGDDTNRLGVGVVVESKWYYGKENVGKVPKELRRGQYKLRPYCDIYRTYDDAFRRENEIRRPLLSTIKKHGK